MEFTPQNRGERIKCMKCNQDAYSNEMVLDPDYKMMVCPICIREKKVHKEVEERQAEAKVMKAVQAEEAKEHPPGWDEEDEMIERMVKEKERQKAEEPTIVLGETEDMNKIRVQCKKCQYAFKYNLETQSPALCPMCGNKTR